MQTHTILNVNCKADNITDIYLTLRCSTHTHTQNWKFYGEKNKKKHFWQKMLPFC